MSEHKSFFKAFWDFFILFSGISTASNLSRTRSAPVVGRGLFLFRRPENPLGRSKGGHSTPSR